MSERVQGCVNPGEISRDELMALAEGDESQVTKNHVQRCAACRREVEHYSRAGESLSRSLFRRSCPPSEILGEYALGVLERAQMMTVARHLVDCGWCKDETEQFGSFLAAADDAQPAGITAGIKRPLARPVMRPRGLVLRGDEEAAGPRSFVAGDVTVIIDQQDPSRGERGKVIAGLIQGSGAAVSDGSV